MAAVYAFPSHRSALDDALRDFLSWKSLPPAVHRGGRAADFNDDGKFFLADLADVVGQVHAYAK